MTDRELLEAAAKAAGIDLRWVEAQTDEHGFVLPDGEAWCYEHIPRPPPHNRREGDSHGSIWDPLTDDADALRLAVKLRMNVFHAGIRVHAMDEDGDIEAAEGHEHDAGAATRRAIVRAAAAIGEAR